ncbi:MAG: sulfotransferase [Halieaceae bacterium]|nr:sulfotransferase [Halieaceae bacterium]
MTNSQMIVCILGMHRSGTSCLTGSLEQAGLVLGDVHTWNPYNQRGNRESQAIVDFHDALLAANGGSWDQPPKKLRFCAKDVSRARALIEHSAGDGPWGFKDPRSLLALPVWQAAAPGVRFIGIFRHPLAVAESMRYRAGGKIPIQQGVALWHHYNRLLYRAWKQQRFPILCFDWEEAVFKQKVRDIQHELGLQSGADGEPFYSSDLKHFDTSRWSGVAWRSRRLYRKLEAACD